MSITIHFSDDTDKLKNMFIEELYSQDRTDPFKNPFIIIPNINVKKWIQLETASRQGVSANLELHYLEEGLINLINKVSHQKDEKKYIFLGDKDRQLDLQLLILSVIINNRDNIELEPVKRYINSGRTVSDQPEEATANKRLWQIAEKLSFYFREYEYQRSEMIKFWNDDKLYFESIEELKNKNNIDGIIRIEKAQKFIYRAVFCGGNNKSLTSLYSTDSQVYTTLPRYAGNIEINTDRKKETIYLFGLSQISPFHFELIMKLNKVFDFKIFQLNYLNVIDNSFKWENAAEILNGCQNILTKKWCKPSIENLTVLSGKLLEEKTDVKFEFSDNNRSGTFLNVLKESFIKGSYGRNVKNEFKKISQDTSFQIAGAPSIRREVESVYQSIMRNMNEDETLKLTDIAILVPDMEKYRLPIKSVFDTSGYISYNLSDTTAGTESMFADGLINGLEIALGNFTRSELIKFILNPCVSYSLGITRETADIWIELIDKLNIYFAYDKSDKKNISAFESGIFTWRQGLKRIRMGKIMGNSEDTAFYDLFPYLDMNTKDGDFLDKFCTSFEKLFEFYNEIRDRVLSGNQWKEKVGYFIEKYLQIPDDMKSELPVKESAVELLNSFERFDSLLENHEIDAYYIISYLKSNINDIAASRGKYLSDGVTISKLSPMKPIPFKIIYIMGLGEGFFPGQSDRSTLDLRNLYRITGDITKTESDAYLFFELFLSAADKLYLTYVSRNIEKDEELYYSPILRELISYIEDNILTPDQNGRSQFAVTELPLVQESSKNFSKANIESAITDLFCCMTDNKRTIRYLYDYDKLKPELKKVIDTKADLSEVPQTAADEFIKSDKNRIIDIKELYDYMINQPKAVLNNKYRIYEDKAENLAIKDSEPLYDDKYSVDNILLSSLRKLIINKTADRNYNEESVITEAVLKIDQDIMKGKNPEGFYGEIVKDKAARTLQSFFTARCNDLENISEVLSGGVFSEKIVVNEGRFKKFKQYPLYNIPESTVRIKGIIRDIFIKDNEVFFFFNTSGLLDKNQAFFLKKYLLNLLQFMLFTLIEGREYKFNMIAMDSVTVYKINPPENSVLKEWFFNLVNDYNCDYGFNYITLDFLYDSNFLTEIKEDNFYENYCTKIEEIIDNEGSIAAFAKSKETALLVKPVISNDIFDIVNKRYYKVISGYKKSTLTDEAISD